MASITNLFQKLKPKSKGYELYTSADQCPLRRFCQVVNQGSLKPLVIRGNPPETELEQAWEDIYSEFSSIIKDQTAELAFLNIKQNTAKRHKIGYQSVLLQAYAANPSQEFAELLATEGFRVIPDAETTLRMAFGRLSKMQKDLAHMERSREVTEKADFELIISEVERFQGYGFDQDKMTVKYFANIYKRFKDHGRKN